MLYIIGYILIAIVSSAVVGGIIYRRKAGVCTCTNRLEGKTVIVTGASAGIGKSAAFDLASRGARVILACRNLEKANSVREWIVSSTGNVNIVCSHLDVSDLDSVRRFAEETLKNETRVDVLINNAGAGFTDRRLSRQGYELTMATNHYGHFLLTHLLLDLIKRNSPSRIINVSSMGHTFYHLDLDDIHFSRRTYGLFPAYAQSKLCNILFTNELARRLQGTGVTVNSLHPGAVATEITNKEGTILGMLLDIAFKIGGKSSKSGAQTTIHLAVSDKVKNITGEYFSDCKITKSSRKARDLQLAEDLWKLSEKEVGLTNEEKCIKH